ncbi:MAG: hypothetical protein H7346_27025 [Burkholderiaceae bacterium]|nr:hypothetical protein [Burkholderiaceae bacterium]
MHSPNSSQDFAVDLAQLNIRVRRGRSICQGVSGLPWRAANFGLGVVSAMVRAVRHGTSSAFATPVRDFAVTAGTQFVAALVAAAVMDHIDPESEESAIGAQLLVTLVGVPIAVYGAGVRWRQLEPGDQMAWLCRALNLVNVVGIPLASAQVIGSQQATRQAANRAVCTYLIRGTLARFGASFGRDFSNFLSNVVMPTVEPRYRGMPLVVGSDLYNRYTATRLRYATTAYAPDVGAHQGYLRDQLVVWLGNAGVSEDTARILAPALSAGIAEAADAFTGVAAHYYAAREHGLEIHIAAPKGLAALKGGGRNVASHGSMRVFYFQLVEMFINASNLSGDRYSFPWLVLRGMAMIPHIASEARGRYASESMSIQKRRETWVHHEENLADHIAQWTAPVKGSPAAFSAAAGEAIRRLEGAVGGGETSRAQGPLMPAIEFDRHTALTARLLLRALKTVMAGTPVPEPTPMEVVQNLLKVFHLSLEGAGMSLPHSDRVPAEIYSNSVVNAFIDILTTFNLVATLGTQDAGEILATAALAAVQQPARLRAFNVFDGSANHNQTMLVPAPAAGYVAGQHGHGANAYLYSLAAGLREAPVQLDMSSVRENMGDLDVRRDLLNVADTVLAHGESMSQVMGNDADVEARQAVRAVLGALSNMDWSKKDSDAEMEEYLVKTVRGHLGEPRAARFSDAQILKYALDVLSDLNERGSKPNEKLKDADEVAQNALHMSRTLLLPSNDHAGVAMPGVRPASLRARFRQVRRAVQTPATLRLLDRAGAQIKGALQTMPPGSRAQYTRAQHLLHALVEADWGGATSDARLSQYLVAALRRDLSAAGVEVGGLDEAALMESLVKLLELSCSPVTDADEREVELGRAALREAQQLIAVADVPAAPAGGDPPLRMHTTTAMSTSSSSTVPASPTTVQPTSVRRSGVELAPVSARPVMASARPNPLSDRFGRLRPIISASGSWQRRVRQASTAINQLLERTGQSGHVYPAAAVAHGLMGALISIDWSSPASDAELMSQLAGQFRRSAGAPMAANLTDAQILQCVLALMDQSLSNEAKEAQATVGAWLSDAAIHEVHQLLGEQGLVRRS